MFQRKVKSLEDELTEAKSSMEESRVKEAQWRSIKYVTVLQHVETALAYSTQFKRSIC